MEEERSRVWLWLLIGAAVLFFFLYPGYRQYRAYKQHQAKLSQLKVGDEVVTVGGLVGKIADIEGEIVVLEVAPHVRIKVLKRNIWGKKEEILQREGRASGSARRGPP